MSKLLEITLKQAQDKNLQVKEQLKQVGAAYMTHREVSAQEAVYRSLSMPLKHFTRDTVFIPAHSNCIRLSVPLAKFCHNSEVHDSDESPWLTNIVDRYLARPPHKSFEIMCLAHFASHFRIIQSKSEHSKADGQDVSLDSKSKFTLQNGLGVIMKRTKSKEAIIRYPKFSKDKQTEDHYIVLLKLYLPHRYNLQLKPPQFDTFEDFYECGKLKLNSQKSLKAVSAIVSCQINQCLSPMQMK